MECKDFPLIWKHAENVISQTVQQIALYIALHIAYINFKSPLHPPDLMVNSFSR